MKTFRLIPRGPFALGSSAGFLCSFTPAAGTSTVADDGRLALSFLSDGRFEPTVVSLAEEGGGLVGHVAGSTDVEAASRQVARVLSLDHDAAGLAGIGERDRIVGELLASAPGFRPVCFPSPYEAALWGILASRISMALASKMKRRLAEAAGCALSAFGQTFYTAPAPEQILALDSFPGIPEEKIRRLHAVALAALEGTLDAERLRSMPRASALAELETIRGVGPWTAEFIRLRGCGVIDELPTVEPRVLRAVSSAYGRSDTINVRELERIAEGWRPYRMWISVLLVSHLHGTPRWRGPERRGRSRPDGDTQPSPTVVA